MSQLTGLHHVTAIAGDPQRNLDFFTSLLGLRFVKLTVNFDDPATYHFYFGDYAAHPGSILTFFPWKNGPYGRLGRGQATAYAYSIPSSSLAYWADRLKANGIEATTGERFGDAVLAFADPDGIPIELVATSAVDDVPGWESAIIPGEHAVRGFHSISLSVGRFDATEAMLTGLLDMQLEQENGDRFRFRFEDGGPGKSVDVIARPDLTIGRVAAGTVHHVAYRVPDDATQAEVRQRLVEAGVQVTPVMDRQYFRSIYFREPSGVLFEVATDVPGFTTDESLATLGTALKLPPWLEPRRDEISGMLLPITLPADA